MIIKLNLSGIASKVHRLPFVWFYHPFHVKSGHETRKSTDVALILAPVPLCIVRNSFSVYATYFATDTPWTRLRLADEVL